MLSTPELNEALVDVFNVHNFGSSFDTNFFANGSNIVVKFRGDQTSGEEYLKFMRKELMEELFPSEKAVSDIFNVGSFPFKFNKGKWSKQSEGDKKREIVKFAVCASPEVISNLQYCFLIERTGIIAKRMIRELVDHGYDRKEAQDYVSKSIGFNKIRRPFRSSCLCLSFNGEGFMNNFIQKYKENMEWSDDDFLDRWEVDGLNMYEKCVKLRDIKLAAEKTRKIIGSFFDVPSSKDQLVKRYKNAISDLIFRETDIPVSSYYCDIFVDQNRKSNGEYFAFIPEVERWDGKRYLNYEEVDKINNALGFPLLSNVEGQTAETRSCRNGGIYALTNKQIAFLIPEIIRKSAITKIDYSYGLEIDYDQQRSRHSSRENTPTDPPSGSILGLPNRYLNEVELAQVRSPTGESQGKIEKKPPRQGSEKEKGGMLYDQLNVAVAGPSARMSSIVVNPGISGPSSSQSVNAAYVPAAQPMNFSPPQLIQSESIDLSRKGAAQNVQVGTSTRGPGSLPPPLIPISSNVSGSQPLVGGPSSSRGAQAGANISEKEEKLIEALLYTFNLMNYTLDGVYTNFFAKGKEIVSLLHDTVDREEYLQKVRDYIIEEYCEDEEEARKLYDLDEFPFKFFPDPDYKKNQNDYEPKKTVIANISSGALSNLKILFSRKFGKNVDAIDINWVKDVEGREKNEWVNYQKSEGDSLEEACKSCFPDEGVISIIPIAFEEDEDEYVLDRSRDICEVQSLYEKQRLAELFKKLLYAFNINNYTFQYTHTNFIVENGKIASFIDNGVNVKEYLDKLRDSTIKDYCVTEEKAKKEGYDLNEFPFKLLPDSDCEKNPKMTVVAKISPGGLFNLKKLFIQRCEEKVEIEDIDINIVEEDVKSKKEEWVNSQVKEHGLCPQAAITSCFPDESKLADIPITKGKSEYWLDRIYDASEVKSFRRERWSAKGTSKAGKMKPEGQDSGIGSSSDTTDAENVSSKAEVESMDCENTGGESSKRSLELNEKMVGLTISTMLNASQSSPAKKLRSNEV